MKNTLLLATVVFSFLMTKVSGQIGINTPTPHTSADLELGSNNKALYLNRVANTGAVANPQVGMIIYDMANNCIKAYQGVPALWSDCFSGTAVASGTITSLTCSSATLNPAGVAQGQPYSGILTVPYNGGDGGYYPAQTIASTGITGLTATLQAGLFATGNGSLHLSVSGTPSASGTASFPISIGGQTCTVSLSVTANSSGVLPGSITLMQNRKYWMISLYDQDYLPYTVPTGSATTNTVNADGVNEATLLNLQGAITTTGITVSIPVDNASGSGTINAWSSIITVPASLTQDGISRQLELLWASQAYTGATTSITATIRSIGGTLNVKQLDLNAGLGTDYLGILLGMFQYPYNSTGALTNYELRDIPGIPDRMFGLQDNGGAGTQNRHNFLYLPVLAEDGKIWLNNNLGATYSLVGNANFNPLQQATAGNDFRAFGSCFEWGRKPDGHELMNWTNGSSGTGVNPVSTVKSDNPTHAQFIYTTTGNATSDWRVNLDNTLWQSESSANNPCPRGFRVPATFEVNNWMARARVTGEGFNNSGYNTALKMSLEPTRAGNSATFGDFGGYWSSTTTTAVAPAAGYIYVMIYEFSAGASQDARPYENSTRMNGHAVRCIQN